jgi:hypothetical protein
MSEKPKQDDARPHLDSARVALGNFRRARRGSAVWKLAAGHLNTAVERLRELGFFEDAADAAGDAPGVVSDPDRPALDPFHPDGG